MSVCSKQPPIWTKVKWPYNGKKPYCNWECWHIKANIVTIILYPGQWPTEGWSFVVVGQYSGFLKGITDLALAKAEIERRLREYHEI